MTEQIGIDLEMTVRRSPRVGGVTITENGEYVDPAPKPKKPIMHQWADAQAKMLWGGVKLIIAGAIALLFIVMATFMAGVFGLNQ